MERKIVNFIGKVLVTKYNISLIIMTILWWVFGCYLPYYNTNFDMISTVANYVFILSSVSILIGSINCGNHYKHLVKLGVLSVLLIIFISSASKSVLTSYMCKVGVKPIGMFSFFLLLKNLWLAAGLKEHAQTEHKSTGNEA